jgi:uncharacterized protein (TIGR02611 family)
MYNWSLKKMKRMIVALIGTTILFVGIAMIFLPGPAVVVIPAALGILATEFAWARKALQLVKDRIKRTTNSLNNNEEQKKEKSS